MGSQGRTVVADAEHFAVFKAQRTLLVAVNVVLFLANKTWLLRSST